MSVLDKYNFSHSHKFANDDERSDDVEVSLPGGFIRADKQECRCVAKSISSIILRVEAGALPSLNEHVILDIRDIGRIEGWVVRVTPYGFAIVMELTGAQRNKISAYLNSLKPSESSGPTSERRHHRCFPLYRFCTLKLPDNDTHVVQLIDVSLSGTVFIFRSEVLRKMPIGCLLILGKRTGRLSRKNENTISVKFDCPLDAQEFHETIIL
jgi:hypothetical protein